MSRPRKPEPDYDMLDRYLTWLYGDARRCKCPHDWVSLGRVDGIDMGYGWRRVGDRESCPEHNAAARSARAERLRHG